MKWDDRNIDQLFRDAAQNTSAPEYSSSYWNDISSMLDEEQRKRKGLVFWSVSGSLVLSALFIILFTSTDSQTDEQLYAQTEGSHLAPDVFIENTVNSSVPSNINSTPIHSIDKDSEISTAHRAASTNEIKEEALNQETTNLISNSTANPDQSENLMNKELISVKAAIKSSDKMLKQTSVNLLPVRELQFNSFDQKSELASLEGRTWNLTAEVNFGAMENYKTSRPMQSGIMSFAIKSSFEKSSVLFNTGLGLQVTTNSDLVVSKRAKFYSFGVVNYQTDLSYQNMYDVYIPLEIGYRYNKTKFGMGLQANYLINTSMKLQNYEDNMLISSESIRGYSNGLNKLSGQGYVWISQQLSQRLSAGLRIGTNFTNRIKEGGYFNESATTNPVFGQLTLRYNIFK